MRLTIGQSIKLSQESARHCTKKCTMVFGSPDCHQKLRKKLHRLSDIAYMRAGDPPKNAVFLNNTYARVMAVSRSIVNTVLSDIVMYKYIYYIYAWYMKNFL